jgi:hypothetical protein
MRTMNFIDLEVYLTIKLDIRAKMEEQKILNKDEIINDKDSKYIWSVIIKKKK